MDLGVAELATELLEVSASYASFRAWISSKISFTCVTLSMIQSLQRDGLNHTVTFCHLFLELNNRGNKILFVQLHQVLLLSIAFIIEISVGGKDVSIHAWVISQQRKLRKTRHHYKKSKNICY